jgi:hypothetical protein
MACAGRWCGRCWHAAIRPLAIHRTCPGCPQHHCQQARWSGCRPRLCHQRLTHGHIQVVSDGCRLAASSGHLTVLDYLPGQRRCCCSIAAPSAVTITCRPPAKYICVCSLHSKQLIMHSSICCIGHGQATSRAVFAQCMPAILESRPMCLS